MKSNIKIGTNDTLQLLGTGVSDPFFLDITDAGLTTVPPVDSLAVSLDTVDDEATLTWSIPSGANYDNILVFKNGVILDTLDGTATSHVHENVRSRLGEEPFQTAGNTVRLIHDYDLIYHVIAVKDTIRSNQKLQNVHFL